MDNFKEQTNTDGIVGRASKWLKEHPSLDAAIVGSLLVAGVIAGPKLKQVAGLARREAEAWLPESEELLAGLDGRTLSTALKKEPSTTSEELLAGLGGRNPQSTAEKFEAAALDPRKVPIKDLTPSMLDQLAAGSRREKEIAAFHQNTTAETLAELAAPTQPNSLRAIVAGNTHTPEPVLSALAEGHDLEIDRNLARNAATPPNLLSRLVEQWRFSPNPLSFWVPTNVARNPSLTPELLRALSEHPDRQVSQFATKRLLASTNMY